MKKSIVILFTGVLLTGLGGFAQSNGNGNGNGNGGNTTTT